MYTTTNTQSKCSVNITTNRNRVKDYSGKVYLKDGQKFELEIFNPHTFKVLAKIKFNGHHISDSGIVVKPGQRIYLERYLDSNNAFLFSTYEVDGTAEALRAIAENGNIEVEFYSEYIPSGVIWTGNADWTLTTYTHDLNVTYGGSINCLYSDSLNETVKGSSETGRVEMGETTNQSFGSDNSSFNAFVFESIQIKMLPTSAKPTEVTEIRNYCTGCGTRIKKATWKFCPSCGEKL